MKLPMVGLHLGCGGIYKESSKDFQWINIDLKAFEGKVDREFDLSKPLDYADNNVDVIEAYHLFEHLPFSSIEAVISSWYRVIKPKGKIVLEMPDFDECIREYLKSPNDNSKVASIYGNQDREGQYHHWGWNKTRLKFLLEGAGFKNIQFPAPQDYHKDLEPCLRVEAEK